MAQQHKVWVKAKNSKKITISQRKPGATDEFVLLKTSLVDTCKVETRKKIENLWVEGAAYVRIKITWPGAMTLSGREETETFDRRVGSDTGWLEYQSPFARAAAKTAAELAAAEARANAPANTRGGRDRGARPGASSASSSAAATNDMAALYAEAEARGKAGAPVTQSVNQGGALNNGGAAQAALQQELSGASTTTTSDGTLPLDPPATPDFSTLSNLTMGDKTPPAFDTPWLHAGHGAGMPDLSLSSGLAADAAPTNPPSGEPPAEGWSRGKKIGVSAVVAAVCLGIAKWAKDRMEQQP